MSSVCRYILQLKLEFSVNILKFARLLNALQRGLDLHTWGEKKNLYNTLFHHGGSKDTQKRGHATEVEWCCTSERH